MLLSFQYVNAQKNNIGKTITGEVYEIKDGTKLPLIGANIYWEGTTVGSFTDLSGNFEIERVTESNNLIVSFIGYVSDTISITSQNTIKVELKESVELGEITVKQRVKTTNISTLTPRKVEQISSLELQKAACCNLSESFETNPSVDVAFTDAVTGMRQIQMLGLAGAYTQFTRENIPTMRGLTSIYGLTYIPGTWIESIQLNKGAGSVINGYESIAGQINVELKKPEEAERFFVNLYGNSSSRAEANAHINRKINDQWSTGLLLHGMNNVLEIDHNHDGFMDHPTGQTYIALNRWKFSGKNGLQFQAGIKGTLSKKEAGQIHSSETNTQESIGLWKMKNDATKLDAWLKLGKVFPSKPGRSVAVQSAVSSYETNSTFGLRDYNATEQSFYTNFLYMDIIKNTNHKIISGISIQGDNVDEHFVDTSFKRTEIVPGAFAEYTYASLDVFSAVAGIRADYSSLFGMFLTPRLHIRYAPFKRFALRASAGRGLKTANIISENSGYLASSREFIIRGDNSNKPYGLNPEIAWNYGVNITQKFRLDYRDGSISADFYRTDFQNQVVVDLDSDPHQVQFYNLEGTSYSTSTQVQFDYELVKRLDVRLAYRWYDVKTTYSNKLRKKPLLASQRAFINIGYHTRKYWKFDYTVNWQGEKRVPINAQGEINTYSPYFFLMNAQITKSFKEKFDVYAGVENILDYTQDHPIIGSDKPFSEDFDASMIWAPVSGRKIYAGLRYTLK